MLKAKELRDQSKEELELMYHDTMDQLFKLKDRARVEKLENPDQLRKLRRQIARLLTILKDKN